jgi:hypothetical protein
LLLAAEVGHQIQTQLVAEGEVLVDYLQVMRELRLVLLILLL